MKLERDMKCRKSQVFWNTTPCGLRSSWHFEGNCCPLMQCLKSFRRIFQKRTMQNFWDFLVMLKSFIHLFYKFCDFISSFLSTVFRIPLTCPSSCILRTLLPSLSPTLNLHPKHAVTGRPEKMSVMLRIKLLNPLAFCMVDFALSKVATHPYSQ